MSIFQTYVRNERQQQLINLAERLGNQALKRIKQAEEYAQLPKETVTEFKQKNTFHLHYQSNRW